MVEQMSRLDPEPKWDKLAVPVLFALALSVRLAFNLLLPQPSLFGDASGYDEAARVLLETRHHLSTLPVWLDAQSRAFGTIRRYGPGYPVFLATMYLLGGESIDFVRVVQSSMDAGTCVLLYLIGSTLFNRGVGLGSALLAAFYSGLIVSTGRLLTETLAIFFLLTGVYLLLRGVIEDRARFFFAGGASVAAMTLVRPALQFLFLMLGIAIVVCQWHREPRRTMLRGLGSFMGGLAILLLPWALATWLMTGHPQVSGGRGVGHALYMGNVVDQGGWQTDVYPVTPELRQAWDPGIHSYPSQSEFLVAAIRMIQRDPGGTALLSLAKLWLYWSRPYNDFRQAFPLPYGAQVCLHRSLVWLALMGLPLALRRSRASIILAFVLFYAVASTTPLFVEVRYVLSAIPLLLIFSSVALESLLASGRKLFQQRDFLRVTGISLSWLAGGLALCCTRVPFVLRIAPNLTATSGRIVSVVGSFVALSLIGFGSYIAIGSAIQQRWTSVTAGFAPSLVIFIVFLCVGIQFSRWHEWKVQLSDPAESIRQAIDLPANIRLYGADKAFVLIDMLGGPGDRYDVTVKVNGAEARRYENGLAASTVFPARYLTFLQTRNQSAEDVRQWFRIPLKAELLSGSSERITVDLSVSGQVDIAHNYVDVWGDYDASPGYFEGPSVFTDEIVKGTAIASDPRLTPSHDTSLYKFVVDDDYRVWRCIPLQSSTSHSSRIVADGHTVPDLSAAPGLQKGQYRIRLLVERADGSDELY